MGLDRIGSHNSRERPFAAFGDKGQRCSAVSPDRLVHHAAFSCAGWRQSKDLTAVRCIHTNGSIPKAQY